MSRSIFERHSGFSFIDLLVALALSSMLLSAFYGSFIGQQRTYAVQERVVDMQQNLRIALDRMTLDIEMAGFGNVKDIVTLPGGVNGFTSVVTPGANAITVLAAVRQKVLADDGSAVVIKGINGTQLTLSQATGEFDGEANKYVSIGGLESFAVTQPSPKSGVLRLDRVPKIDPIGQCLYKIWAITYAVAEVDGKPVLRRDVNTGGGPEVLAQDIESLRFKYYDVNGTETSASGNIYMVWASVTAKTDTADPTYKTDNGFRKRTASSFIAIRNR